MTTIQRGDAFDQPFDLRLARAGVTPQSPAGDGVAEVFEKAAQHPSRRIVRHKTRQHDYRAFVAARRIHPQQWQHQQQRRELGAGTCFEKLVQQRRRGDGCVIGWHQTSRFAAVVVWSDRLIRSGS